MTNLSNLSNNRKNLLDRICRRMSRCSAETAIYLNGHYQAVRNCERGAVHAAELALRYN